MSTGLLIEFLQRLDDLVHEYLDELESSGDEIILTLEEEEGITPSA